MGKKIERVKYICWTCGHTFKLEYKGWYPTQKCPECGSTAHMEGMEAKKESSRKAPSFRRYKDPVAFGYDRKTGKPIAIDKKGKRFDPSETRYNLKSDPRGWKATGKRVK